MAIGIEISDRDSSIFRNTLRVLLPHEKIYRLGNVKDPAEIEALVLWKHSQGKLGTFPNLRWISSLGAGVEHILTDPSLPDKVFISRIVDPNLAQAMERYVLMGILAFHKNLIPFYQNKIEKQWSTEFNPTKELKIGILGLGYLGNYVTKSLHALGFEVHGYSRSKHLIEGVKTYSLEENGFQEFLSHINTLVCLLPATPNTKGILNSSVFSQLPNKSFLINVGRGNHVVEEDLLQAVRAGKIAFALLDVYQQEPLPKDHPFWTEPNIICTPHIASITDQVSAAHHFAENFQRLQTGDNLKNLVNKNLGY